MGYHNGAKLNCYFFFKPVIIFGVIFRFKKKKTLNHGKKIIDIYTSVSKFDKVQENDTGIMIKQMIDL